MNTPNNKSAFRVGLSRSSSSIKKRSSILTPSSASTSNNSVNTTPSDNSSFSSPKTTLKKAVINKKKLEFAAKKHLESSDDEEQNIENLDLESLKALVEKKRDKLAALEKHQAEKAELIDVTEKWKQAGLEAIDELRKFIDPPRSNEEILDSFKIPHEFFL